MIKVTMYSHVCKLEGSSSRQMTNKAINYYPCCCVHIHTLGFATLVWIGQVHATIIKKINVDHHCLQHLDLINATRDLSKIFLNSVLNLLS